MAQVEVVEAAASQLPARTDAPSITEDIDNPFTPKDIGTLCAWFEDAEETTDTARKASERDRDYYDNKQLTAAEKAELNKRGQPDIIVNRIQTKVNYLLGYEAAQRMDPRGFPRTPQDEEAAAACTDGLRYVSDKADLATPFSGLWENMLIEGYGGLEVVVEPDGQGDAEINVVAWPWDRLFYDPFSRRPDFTDARYVGGVIWMDEEDALANPEWPDAKEVISKTIEGQLSSTYDDRPQWKQWSTRGKRKRVRIVQMYYRCKQSDGKDAWCFCVFTKGGKLEERLVPFRDEDDKPLCPMILQSAFVDRENNRYGFVRALIGMQDEINKRRQKMLHEATVRQFKYEDGAVDDVDATKEELAKPDGAVKVNPGFEFELIDRTKEISAHTALQAEAKQEIDLMGPNAALQGKGERSASGRAILANQQGGQVELSLLMDRHRNAKRRTYNVIWALIRQYWTAQKWIRVTDDEKNVRFVGLNRPVTMAEELLKQATDNGIEPDEAKAVLRERSQDPMYRMQLEQVVRTEHIPADMNMDIILDEVPDTANIQQEQFEIMAKLAQAGIPIPPTALIKMSGLRDKQAIIEELEKANSNPAQAQAQEMELANARAQIDKLQAEIGKTVAETEKLRADTLQSIAKADSLDAQTGQIVMPQVIGQPPFEIGGLAQPQGQGGIPPEALQQMQQSAANGQPVEAETQGTGFSPADLSTLLENAGNGPDQIQPPTQQPGAPIPTGPVGQ